MANIFISYSRKNIDFAKKLTGELQKSKLDFWIDWEGIPPTVDWWREIEKGIEEADAFVFLISPDSAKSEFCRQEIEHAIKMGKRLIPLVILETSGNEIPTQLNELNWIFFREYDDFDAAFQKLLTAIHTDYEWLQQHRWLQIRALDWERDNRDKSSLLRGEDLQDAEFQLAKNTSKEPYPTDLQREYVFESRKATDRQKRITAGISIVGVVTLAALAVFGFFQAALATDNAAVAQAESTRAVSNALTAETASTLAIANEQEAIKQAQIALSRQWAAEAKSILSDPLGNINLAALLSLESLKAGYSSQADSALVDSLSKLYTEQIIQYGRADDINNSVSVAITPDGKTIVIGSSDRNGGKVSLYELSSGMKRGEIQLGLFVDNNDIAVSPNGNLLAVASGNVIFVDLSTQTITHQLEGDTWEFSIVTFSPDGKSLLTGSWDKAKLWDLSSENSYFLFPRHTDRLLSMAFSQDSKFVFTSSVNPSVIQWNRAGEQIAEFDEYNQISDIAVSKDGKYLATVTDRKATIWDINAQVPIYDSVRHSAWVNSVAFSPDGKYFVTGGDDYIVRIWNTQTGQMVRALVGHTDKITSLAYSPDGKHILSGSPDGTVRLWNADVKNIRMVLQGHKDTVSDVAISPDGQFIATGSWDEDMNNNYKIWSVQTGRQIHALSGHTWLSSSISFSKDGNYILTGNGDGVVRVFDTKTPNPVRTIPVSPGNWVKSTVFSPDGKLILVGSDDQTATLWNADSGVKILTMKHSDRVRCVDYSPDGNFAATATTNFVISIWDLNTGTLTHTLKTYSDFAEGFENCIKLVYSSDGKYIASASSGGTARLWDTVSGKVVQFFKHDGPVFSVDISPDEKYILTGGADRLARLWDAQTGALVRTYVGHSDAIYDVAFSSDGSFIVTGSADTTVRIWDTELEDTVKRVCSLLSRDFTDEERLRYSIPDNNSTCEN